MRLILALLLALVAATARADDPAHFTPAQRAEIVAIVRQALKSDPSILRDAVIALQAEESARHAGAAASSIERLGPALTAAPGDPVAGNPHGDVTVVEFYDLRCPYCRRMLPVLDALIHSDPKLRVVYKDIPILGPGSVLGAKAVLAAERQGGYLRMHELLMQGGSQITDASVRSAAQTAGLDWARLQRDMADPTIEARINANLALAHTLDIDGTPAFVVGKQLLPGALELSELQDAVKAARMR
jgi:protein-disulfide isomerase